MSTIRSHNNNNDLLVETEGHESTISSLVHNFQQAKVKDTPNLSSNNGDVKLRINYNMKRE